MISLRRLITFLQFLQLEELSIGLYCFLIGLNLTIWVLNQNRLSMLIRIIWRVHFFYQHGLAPWRRH